MQKYYKLYAVQKKDQTSITFCDYDHINEPTTFSYYDMENMAINVILESCEKYNIKNIIIVDGINISTGLYYTLNSVNIKNPNKYPSCCIFYPGSNDKSTKKQILEAIENLRTVMLNGANMPIKEYEPNDEDIHPYAIMYPAFTIPEGFRYSDFKHMKSWCKPSHFFIYGERHFKNNQYPLDKNLNQKILLNGKNIRT